MNTYGKIGNRNAQKTWREVKTVRMQAHCTEDYRAKAAKRARDFGGMGKYIRCLVDADLKALEKPKGVSDEALTAIGCCCD